MSNLVGNPEDRFSYIAAHLSTNDPLIWSTMIRAIPEKIPRAGGRRQTIYFSMGGGCEHFSTYMGHWCFDKI